MTKYSLYMIVDGGPCDEADGEGDIDCHSIGCIGVMEIYFGGGTIVQDGRDLYMAVVRVVDVFAGTQPDHSAPGRDLPRSGKLTHAPDCRIARANVLLDCQLIALSFAVNVFGKSRVRQRLRRSNLAGAAAAVDLRQS